jgi:outer membrane protein TolC
LAQRTQDTFNGPDTGRRTALDNDIAGDPALAGVHNAGLSALPALHLSGNETQTARSAVARAAVIRQVNAIAQRSVQKQCTTWSPKGAAVDRYLVASIHA